MNRNKLVFLETICLIFLIVLLSAEVFLGWILLKPTSYELQINDYNREDILYLIKNINNTTEIEKITYKIPLHHDIYILDYTNGGKKEIQNDNLPELKSYIMKYGKITSNLYIILFMICFISIIMLVIIKIIIGKKIKDIDKEQHDVRKITATSKD